jgi:SAM-dependent methyltransferase
MWRRLKLFVHGEMQSPAYALGVFRRHLRASGFEPFPGFTALELGPGDSVASALIARAHGAGHMYLVDVGQFADRSLSAYVALAQLLRDEGLDPPAVDPTWSFEELLAACHADYLTDGLRSLQSLPTASVDFAWSHAVLEHIALPDFDATAGEVHRALTPNGIASHRIDLQDHLSESLHSLRFRERVWESALFRKSGFYTNRLRASQVIEAFQRAGFETRAAMERWEVLPVDPSQLERPFRTMPFDELSIRGVDLVTRPRPRHDA